MNYNTLIIKAILVFLKLTIAIFIWNNPKKYNNYLYVNSINISIRSVIVAYIFLLILFLHMDVKFLFFRKLFIFLSFK